MLSPVTSPGPDLALTQAETRTRALCVGMARHYADLRMLCMWLSEHPSLPATQAPIAEIIHLGFLINGDTVDDAWPQVPHLAAAEALAGRIADDQLAAARTVAEATADVRAGLVVGAVTVADVVAQAQRAGAAVAMHEQQIARFYVALRAQPWSSAFLAVLNHEWAHRLDWASVAPNAGLTTLAAEEFLRLWDGPQKDLRGPELYLSAVSATDPSLHDGDRAAYDAVLAAGFHLNSRGHL